MSNFLDLEGLRSYHTKLVSLVKSLAGGVTSFNSRTGAVTPQDGDYNAFMVGAVPDTRTVNGKQLNQDITITKDDIEGLDSLATPDLSGYVPSSRTVNGKALSSDISLSATDVSALPISGGTLTGDLRIKGSGNSGTKINLGDSDYVHILEPAENDDCLEIKAKKVNFVLSDETDTKFTVNGESPFGSSGSSVGQSMAGQSVQTSPDAYSSAGEGAEIFNDYRSRSFSGSYASIGNVAAGEYSHAEGTATTASASYSHAEGKLAVAKGYASHAEGDTTVASGADAHAEGYFTRSSKSHAHAEGHSTEAAGTASHAEGVGSKAEGDYSHAEGGYAKASGSYSHSEGYETTAGGHSAHAEGYKTSASNLYTHAEGELTEASGEAAHAEGCDTVASGKYSHAEGYGAKAKANYSHAGGLGTMASYPAQTAIGKYNLEIAGGSSSSLFIVGAGSTDSARSNCFRVTDTGTFASGSYNSSGADYAELFEWLDGNVNNEDRIGLFVTLDGEYIRLANSTDKFILGIVSGNPSVVGDVHDDQWQGMYLYDIYDRPLYEDVEVPDETIEEPDPEDPTKTITRVLIPAHTEHRQKLNPNYDHTQTYIPRTNRKEWACVGMMGKLVVRDDGSCEVNGYATVGTDGKATKSYAETKYRVISRIDEEHVRVLVLANS